MLKMLQTLLVIILLVGCGGEEPLATETGAELACGLGTYNVQGSCMPLPSPVCGGGTHKEGGTCVADPTDIPKQVVCGEGTHEVNGICVLNNTKPPCGSGTHEENGECFADDCGGWSHWNQLTKECVCNDDAHLDETAKCVPKQEPKCGDYASWNWYVSDCVCNSGYHFDSLRQCITNDTKPIRFTNAGIGLSPKYDGHIVASYSLSNLARVYIKLRPSLTDDWKVWHFNNEKVSNYTVTFGPFAPDTTIFWRMEAKNDKDEVVDTYEGTVYVPASNNKISFANSSDTPSPQQLVMGTNNVLIMKFKLLVDAQDDFIVNAITLKDKTVNIAAKSLKNVRLINATNGQEWGEISNINIDEGEFLSAIVPINKEVLKGKYEILINIVADITSWADGGANATHQLVITGATATTKNGNHQVEVGWANDYICSSVMQLVRAKLSIAKAADSPSGQQAVAQEQVIAKFAVANSGNIGNYSITISHIRINVLGVALKSSVIKIYRNSLKPENLTAIAHTTTEPIGFKDLVIENASCQTLIITLNTQETLPPGKSNLQVEIPNIFWTDGVGKYNNIDSLPISGGTLSYEIN